LSEMPDLGAGDTTDGREAIAASSSERARMIRSYLPWGGAFVMRETPRCWREERVISGVILSFTTKPTHFSTRLARSLHLTSLSQILVVALQRMRNKVEGGTLKEKFESEDSRSREQTSRELLCLEA